MTPDPDRDDSPIVELPELAELLADQFEILDDVRPTNPRVIQSDGDLVFTFVWPYIPADALLARSPRRAQLVNLRELLLQDMGGYLVEVVQIARHRMVTGTASELGRDPRHATVSFALGASDADLYGDDVEAVRNWAAQLRRHAREQRRGLDARREELRRVRDQLVKLRQSS